MSDATRRLRVQHVLVQPVLLWDDGTDLEPGPELEPILVPISKLSEYVERLPDGIAQLQAQHDQTSGSDDSKMPADPESAGTLPE